MKIRLIGIFVIGFVKIFSCTFAYAQKPGWLFPVFELGSSLELGEGLGFEAGTSLLTTAMTPSFFGNALNYGPRLHLVWNRMDGANLLELSPGMENTLWIVNAVGIGGALDLRVPLYRDDQKVLDSPHIRLSGHLGLRVLRHKEFGAWALRGILSWDSRYQWSLGSAITWQWDGVPGASIE